MMTMCSIITVSYKFFLYLNETLHFFSSYYTAGPTVEPIIRVTILSSRDTDPNVELTLSFNVTFGPPSRVFCRYGSTTILHNVRYDPKLSREVIRSQYVNSSQPDMTRVTVKVNHYFIRNKGTYACQVFVEGRVNIVNGTYDHDTKGSGTCAVNITGE